MLAALPHAQAPVIRNHYPHMMVEDTGVWSAFLMSPPVDILKVWYDLHVGEPIHVPAEDPKWVRDFSSGVSRKRIDVVIETKPYFYVIEIKPYANMVALGQVLTYLDLFKKEFKVNKPVLPSLVCWNYDKDLYSNFSYFHITVWTCDPSLIV